MALLQSYRLACRGLLGYRSTRERLRQGRSRAPSVVVLSHARLSLAGTVTGNVIVIHPGIVKTATSTLQQWGFSRHPDIHFLGVAGRGDETERALRQIGSADSIHYDEKTVRERIFAATRERPGAKVTVVSHENYCLYEASDKGQTARRLHRIFPEARILFTLRRQQDVV